MNTKDLVGILIARGMKQHKIASLVGCTQVAISLWANGKREARVKYWEKLKELVAKVENEG